MSRPPAEEWSRSRSRDRERPDQDRYAQDDRYHDDAYHPDDDPSAYHPDDDPSLADDVLSVDASAYDDEDFAPRRHKRRSPAVRWASIVAALAVVVIGGWVALQSVGNLIPDVQFGTSAPEDYEGEGSGEVTVEIPEGAGGGQIGQVLLEADVVASAEAFSNLAAADPRATDIQPGTYLMAEQMSADSALERLLDPGSRQVAGVTVREGLWTEEVFAILAEETGNAVEDYEAVDPEELDLPAGADGELDGYLYPDTYQFSPNDTPQEQLQAMVDLGIARYEELGIEEGELRRTLTVASLVQAEGQDAEDLPRVARVVENRLAEEQPLGFDSTIHYMFKERGRAGTTDEQRATENPYNTYLNAGLPPGPINNPGSAAIQAAMDPAEGGWLYFVTVNPDTGETLFADTFEEHLVNQEQFQQWCRDNPDRC